MGPEITVEIFNSTSFRIPKSFLKKETEKLVKDCKLKSKKVVFSLSFVGSNKAKKINLEKRGASYVPEVLTFENLSFSEEEVIFEILFCPQIIKKRAKKEKKSFREILKEDLAHAFSSIC